LECSGTAHVTDLHHFCDTLTEIHLWRCYLISTGRIEGPKHRAQSYDSNESPWHRPSPFVTQFRADPVKPLLSIRSGNFDVRRLRRQDVMTENHGFSDKVRMKITYDPIVNFFQPLGIINRHNPLHTECTTHFSEFNLLDLSELSLFLSR
jgi:hypothetical protein